MCRLKYNLYIRNPDVEIYRLVYEWVDSEGVGGAGGVGEFWEVPPEFYWATFTAKYIFEFLSPRARSIGILVG
jgi:hypothetical protein